MNARNVSVIGHLGHGKSTLSRLIVSHSIGHHQDDTQPYPTTTETLRCKNYSSSCPYQDQRYDINLIDTPGHGDFSSEVSAALRVSDGAMLVVDYREGFHLNAETMLKAAYHERVVHCLVINKLDLALQDDPEECYQKIVRIVEFVQVATASFSDDLNFQPKIDPVKGNVVMGSSEMEWMFTLTTFAKLYAKKFNVSEDALVERLWGDWFFCHSSKKWQNHPVSNTTNQKLKRGFCEFVLEPILNLFEIVRANDWSKLKKALSKLRIDLDDKEVQVPTGDLLKTVFQRFLPVSEILPELIVNNLPSPTIAQSYRYSLLYTGPLNDRYATAIRNCDEDGPLVAYISKMLPCKALNGQFIALCRILSGTLKQDHSVRVMGPDYDPSKTGRAKNIIAQVRGLRIIIGEDSIAVSEATCGHCIGIVGLNTAILKMGTIVDLECEDAFPIKNMVFSSSPLVQMDIDVQQPQDLPKLLEGFKKLSASDPLIQCLSHEDGHYSISGSGEYHLEVCFRDLESSYCKNVKLLRSKIMTTFKETVIGVSGECMSKSPNYHNRIYMQALPLEEELCTDLENKILDPLLNYDSLSNIIVQNYGWDESSARQIWCFGPNKCGPNVLLNCIPTHYVAEAKQHIATTFQWVSDAGALCEEGMRGVRFNLLDACLVSDAIHRGGGQVIPASRKAFYASQLSAQPRLAEPIHLCVIQTDGRNVDAISRVLQQRRGTVLSVKQASYPFHSIMSYVPVSESFGLAQELGEASNSQVLLHCSFDHWQIIDSDPYDTTGRAHRMITEKRERKGLSLAIPTASNYLSTL